MLAKGLTPILNVSDIQSSFAWFEKLGWKKHWDWGSPATFGAVCSGECEIFLCQDGQGGRGKSALTTTSGFGEAADRGVWMSIWVDDVDAIHEHCLKQGLEVTRPPTDEPWSVREMHLRHPDGHVPLVTLDCSHRSRTGLAGSAYCSFAAGGAWRHDGPPRLKRNG